MSYPRVYPSGTTIYNAKKCWNGYTVYAAMEEGIVLIDMNGKEVRMWEGMHGFPAKILPNGHVIGCYGERDAEIAFQDNKNVVELDFDGNEVWKFDHYQEIEDPGHKKEWMARQHHDYQREGNPVGYYAPGMEPKLGGGKSLMLTHNNPKNTEKISTKPLLDDVIIETDEKDNIVWEWSCTDHFNEFGFDKEAKKTIMENPNMHPTGFGDWLHINSISWVGPNKWFDAGDTRFKPTNVIASSREANIIFIVDRDTNKIVWKLGPDYNETPEIKKIGQIIGQHHAHIIPQGLPGEGNLMIFDNGGWAGYGAPNPNSASGSKNCLRDFSRVLEINPTTMKIVWEHTPKTAGWMMPFDSSRFYSPYISSAQRLPNGNTMICEGFAGRFQEITKEHEIVWEYISPYWGKKVGINMVYRAYRAPYDWVPQLPKPKEVSIKKIDSTQFRVPGAAAPGCKNVVKISKAEGFQGGTVLCVLPSEDK